MRQPGGFALVLVLGVIVLLVVLVVGFISSAGTERAAAAGFKATVSTRQLADTAVSLVQGQINMATTQGSTVAWASQPGMVRTFNNTNGGLINAYKLYSATEMIGNSLSFDASGKLTADYPPNTWTTNSAIWTDLNSPVEVDGITNYPILDPSSLGSTNVPEVPEGFAITNAPGVNAYQSAPMPVRWLYVLRDGSVVAPTQNPSNTATIPGAGISNPILGRIAFWTDDDTCKVNINTASEGTYWDTPRAASTQELSFAKYQPAQKEWQRYPGHPATTSLSAVFPALSATQIYDLVPRVIGGGSSGGTAIATSALDPANAKRIPLYASVDELLFQTNRTSNAGLNKTQVAQAKFFLTAQSRAPETSLFNLPRIACWPVYKLGSNGTNNPTRTTAFDRLIAFCSSTGTLGNTNSCSYIFQRENAASSVNDINLARNLQLYGYLSYLTGQEFPGFGGNFSAKYGTDRNQILTEIFDYIRSANLADSTLAVANRFANNGNVQPTKYTSGISTTFGFGRTWTLSELAIHFICNAQADDPATAGVDESAGSNVASGSGTNNAVLGVTPLAAGERMVQAIIIPEFFAPMQGWVQINQGIRMKITGLGGMLLEGNPLFVGAPDTDSATIPSSYSGAPYLSNLGGPVGFRQFGVSQVSPARGNLPADVVVGAQNSYPYISVPVKISPAGTTMRFNGANLTVEIYPSSGPMDDTTVIQKIPIQFPAGDFPIPTIVTAGTTLGGTNNYTSKEAWWAFSRAGAISTNSGRLNNITLRPYGGDPTAGAGDFIRSGFDTVRSMVPSHGDYRIVAGNANVPASLFVKHPLYDTSARMAHNLSAGPATGAGQAAGRGPGFATTGKYLSSVTYPDSLAPDIPSNATNATEFPEATGDFDTGLSLSPDGPFLNKPDEGNIKDLTNNLVPYFDAYWQSTEAGPTFFSPNRQMPSPGMLGSLPSRVLAGEPWRTLLFRPQPSHPADLSYYSGSSKIQDHLLLDLFWMPVVEPYAISDRFSTAGKINLNYQIVPFTYITRSTGIRALLKSEKVAAIPKSLVASYKPASIALTDATIVANNPAFRLPIDADQTLSQFKAKFDQGGIFKSASEICDIHIVPTGSNTVAQMANTTTNGFWATNALTGDNLRERIYTTLYPRLTTKSNTFTVHFRVQALQQVPTSTAGTWTEGRDRILGEYRGATSLERFIDANNTSIPDYAATPANIPNLDPLDKFYRWRIVENRQFAP